MAEIVVAEFGSCSLTVGVAGDGLPRRSIDSSSILTIARSNIHSNLNNSTQRPMLSLDSGGAGDGEASAAFDVILDMEAYNYCISSSYSSSSSQSTFTEPHHRHLFAASVDAASAGDTEIAGAALRHLLRRESLDDSDSLVAVVPDAVFASDAAFDSWASAIFAAGFNRFFPLRTAVAATIESGRPSAVVLDMGHRAARIRVVQDGFQLGTNNNNNSNNNSFVGSGGGILIPDCEVLSGRQVSQIFEADLVSCCNHNMATSIAARNDYIISGKPMQGDKDDDDQVLAVAASDGARTNMVDALFRSYFGCDNNGIAGGNSQKKNNFACAAQAQLHRSRIVREAKHRLGCVAPSRLNFQATTRNSSSNNDSNGQHQQQPTSTPVSAATFVAPDGQEVILSGAARCSAFEQLFTGTLQQQQAGGAAAAAGAATNGRAVMSVSGLIKMQLAALTPDLRLTLPVIVVGGTARADGFQPRLARELLAADSQFTHQSLKYPADPFPQWRGASFVAAAAPFQRSCWVTQRTIQEQGLERVRRSMP